MPGSSNESLLCNAEIASSGSDSVRVSVGCDAPFDRVADSSVFEFPDELRQLRALLVLAVVERRLVNPPT